MKSLIFKIQGAYYAITGFWPVVHMSSFLFVTGPKTDIWLVEMVGLLSVSIGAALFLQAKNQPYFLGICASISYLIIDCVYVFKNIMSPIYLSDAAIQIIVLICYYIVWTKRDSSFGKK